VEKITKRRGNNYKFITLLIISAFVLTCAAVLTGGYTRTGYSLEVGRPSPSRFVANRDVVNTVATEKLKDDARKSVMDFYITDSAATETLLRQMDDFFAAAFDRRKLMSPIYTPGQDPSAQVPQGQNPQDSDFQTDEASGSVLSEYLSQSQIDELINLDTAAFNDLRGNLTVILEDILERGVRPDTVESNIADARERISLLEYPSAVRNLASEIISDFIKPNRIIDTDETERLKEEKADAVEPVICLSNQKIIDENEIITAEAYGLLEALGYVNRSFAENILPSVGAIILIVVLFVFSMMYINHFHQEILDKRKILFLIFTLYACLIVITWAMAGGNYFFVPVLLFTVLISMLISHRLSIFLNFAVTVITLLIFKGDIDYLVYYLIAGTAIGVLAAYTTERSKVVFVGLLSALVNVGVLIGYSMFFETSVMGADSVRRLVSGITFASGAGLLSVILATGSLPVWEAFFGIITPIKLLDLTNPNNEVLNRLTIEAPGTYHHSLIVANLAETAAYDIGADPAIARVGGYYHDIGKLKYPQYFSENIVGENPHDKMETHTSIEVIRSHVDFGLEMAETYKLPTVIKDIIVQHHGSTLMKYFYFKTKNDNPGLKVDERDFRYLNPIPNSKEAAAVMLADTAEAAVRSRMTPGTPIDEVEKLVRSLIKDKLDDGQLENSGFTIKDLDIAAKAFMRVFKGMYHERVPYPTDGKKP